MSGPEIASVCFGGFPGTNRHLREIARSTALTRHLVVSSADPASVEVAFLRQHLAEWAPRCVIFGSWHVAYEPLVEAARAARLEIAVLWTSSSLQTELSGETATLAALLADRRIGRFFVASEDMADRLAAAGRPSDILPHPCSVGAGVRPREERDESPPIVSLFCAPNEYRRKNVITCLRAVSGLDLPYRLHLNGAGDRPQYRTLLQELGIAYRDHGWMEQGDYERALDRIDIGLQVSLAESFNYVAAEHFARAIPVLVSTAVPCAYGLPKEVARLLVVTDTGNPDEIRAKVRVLLAQPATRRAAGQAAQVHIEQVAARNSEMARRTLEAVLAGS